MIGWLFKCCPNEGYWSTSDFFERLFDFGSIGWAIFRILIQHLDDEEV